MNDPQIPKDFATAERRRFVENISPFHRDESFMPYALAWILALLFNTRMPHERIRHDTNK